MRRLSLLVLLTLFPLQAYAADRLVPGTYATVNAALAAAGSGDVIKIAVGSYTECITLPNKGPLGSPIIIRADTSDGNLPAAGVRIVPGTHGAFMATITAGASCPAIQAAVGAEDYQIGPGLKFTSNPKGDYAVIELGRNNSSQQLEADQPKDITVDRIWVDGDPYVGQKSAVDLNGRNLTVKNSYLDKLAGVGQDSSGVRGFNGTGPYIIYNNYVSSAGYEVIFGGDQPNMMTYADIDSGATKTTATLSSFKTGHTIATLKVGQYVSILTNAGALRQHPKIISCGTSTPGATCSSNNITFEALTVAPDTGAASDIQWGAIPTGISIRRNYFFKPTTWMNPILGTPPALTPTASTASGALAAGTYYYRVNATRLSYQNNRIYSTAAAEVSATLSAVGQVTLNWTAVSGATAYRVYRTSTSGTYAGYIEVATNSLVDTGGALTGTSTVPGGTKFVVKNMLELKFAVDVQIDSNIFKNSMVGAESGYEIWFKSNNYGTANYMHTRNVTFEKNVMDGADGCFSLLGRIDSAGSSFTRPLENVTIRNNICFDSNSSWMEGKATVYAMKTQSPIVNLTVENNTFQHTMRGLMYLTKTTNPLSSLFITSFAFRNNIARKETYGIFGGSCAQGNGTECFTEATEGTSSLTGNVLGGPAGTYPSGNTHPAYTEYEGSTHFESYQHTGGVIANFALKTGSTWRGTAVGGGDPGANISLLTSATSGVTTGTLEGTSAPDITTTSPLTSVVQNAAMSSQCIAVTGGVSSYTYAIPSGSTLPTGTSINASTGCITGTPTVPGTYTFNVRVTDSSTPPLVDTQQFQWTITAASATLTITTTTLDAVQVSQMVSKQIVATGGTLPYSFSASGLPTWLTLSVTGLLEGVAPAAGTSNFTVTVTDGVAATDPQALSQLVNAETQTCGRRARFRISGITLERAFFRGPTAPSITEPECARRDDSWFDTTANTRKIAKTDPVTGSLVWALDIGEGVGANVVTLNTDDAPTLGAMIIGTEDGLWTLAPGLDASAIITGTIDPARLPAAGQSIPQTTTVRADATDFSMAATASFSEITSSSLHRVWLDLTNASEMKIHFMQTSVAVTTPRIEVQYSLNNGSSWTTTGVSATFGTVANTYIPGTWTSIPVGAQAPVLLRVGTIGGNGSESPDVANIYISVR